MSKFKARLKDKFNFDVSALDDYTDEQSSEFITDIIESSKLLGMLRLEEGVKGSRELKLLTADMTLKTMVGCTPSPTGAVTFSGRQISAKRLYAGIEFCNEDLNGKYTQMLNVLGANRQDSEMVLENVLIAYLGVLLRRKAQRVVVLGDTLSGDPELALFDGLVKLIDNDALVNVAYSLDTAIDESNGYDNAKLVFNTIPAEVFDDGLNVVILTGRTEARAIIDQVWADKDFNANIDDRTDDGGSISFTLPTTDIKVMSIPELSGTGKMYGFIFDYAFLGTDLEDDLDTIAIKYDDYDNKLKAEAMLRLGTQFVLPQYWTRLRLTPTS